MTRIYWRYGSIGKITLNSSSLSFPGDSYPIILNATRIKIFNRTNDSPV